MNRQMISRRKVLLGGAALSASVAAPSIVRAQAGAISVGFVTGQTGPGASIAFPIQGELLPRWRISTRSRAIRSGLVQLDDGAIHQLPRAMRASC